MIRFVFWLFALFTALPASAQIVVNVPGAADVPLALPPAQLPAGEVAGSDELWETIWKDLEMSGYFSLIDPDAYIEKGKGVEPGTFDFADWRILRTSVLVKTRLVMCEGQVCADAFVYDASGATRILARRFRAPPGQARYQGHAIANAVLLAVTGQPGFFGARLVAVGAQSGSKEIYLLDLDGKGVAPVTKNGSVNLSPAWAPDGRTVSWTSYKKGQPDLYSKELATGRVALLSNRKGVNISPSFSPDGKTLCMARSGPQGDSDLYLLDAATGAEIKRLTDGGGIDVSPNFSSDGRSIAFASERSGGSHVYLLDVGSAAVTRLTFDGAFNTDPVISPDGTKVAFVGRVAGGFDIYVVNRDGTGMYRVTEGRGDNEDPAWSPDGRYLVFSSTRSGRSELWLATADGRHQAKITNTGGWFQPAFAPAGR
ncbi:MAG: PD40 domain-containing protein [Deltaproteobacteria bacterium]|nr:PD40 domain-containing protein [Deltaproteobacteria bacterium]